VGHDWGGRAVYIMSALQPDRLRSGTVMSIGYAPRGQISVPDFDQARRWWYQWFTTVDGGVQAVRDDPVGFARIQWETWGPPGWFKADEFEATAESFRSPDWVDVTLNCYRSRYLPEPLDPRYEGQRKAVGAVERLSTRMLVIHGGLDFCNDPSQSDGQAHLFTGGFRRLVLEGVGHFPAREVPNVVASALISHLQSTL
jgi:pimeloyl-ACP methyl ester carboxylesterase